MKNTCSTNWKHHPSHLTGKKFTQRIERNNLTLRTRIKRLARKTICFSRSVEIHEKVIGTFIEKHMFY
ncbi:Transposase [Shigella dysenteriae 1617]|uniref:Transposase n=1 Tax=Shigella dysenteriae 1617 TaxID=754093 RepID=A0A0A6ZRJ3_SHIDY|nr:Transposase [Shigella dysenteriae 1617]